MPTSSYEISARLLYEAAVYIESQPLWTIDYAVTRAAVKLGVNSNEAWGFYGTASTAVMHLGGWLNRNVRQWELEIKLADKLLMLRMCSQWCRDRANEIARMQTNDPIDIKGETVILVTPVTVVCDHCGHKSEIARRRWARGGEVFRIPCPRCERVLNAQFTPQHRAV